MFKKILFLFLAVLSLNFISCSKNGDDDIETYIKTKNLTPLMTDEGLYYIIDVPGNLLRKPKINSDVRVAYKGTLLNGKQFDASTGPEHFSTNLSNVIAGWRKGLVLFGEGGKGKLIIPSFLAYGSQAVGDIPANSALVFEVELLQVKN